MYFDPTDRAALKAHAKGCMKRCAPNIFLVSILWLVLTNAPTYVTEGPTLQLMLQADSLEQAVEIYQSSGIGGGIALSLAVMAMNFFLSLVSVGWIVCGPPGRRTPAVLKPCSSASGSSGGFCWPSCSSNCS